MTMEQQNQQPEIVVPEAEDFLPLLGTDHIELIVGNAKQSAYYYMQAWGFKPHRLQRTGNREQGQRELCVAPGQNHLGV